MTIETNENALSDSPLTRGMRLFCGWPFVWVIIMGIFGCFAGGFLGGLCGILLGLFLGAIGYVFILQAHKSKLHFSILLLIHLFFGLLPVHLFIFVIWTK